MSVFASQRKEIVHEGNVERGGREGKENEEKREEGGRERDKIMPQ